MKMLLFMGLLLSGYWLNGQSSVEKMPISIAYFGQFGYIPGAKISTEFILKPIRKNNRKNVFISPQVGFFVRPSNNTNLMINMDVGIKKRKEGRSAFSAASLGLGYWYQSQIETVSVQLGDGSQSTSGVSRSYFLPSINYAFGNRIYSQLNWYSKLGVGQRFGGNINSTTTVFLELGLQYKPGK